MSVILVLLCSINSIMVLPNRGVVSHAVTVKQEHEEIALSAQVTGGGGRRTASLKTKGRMIQLKLKIVYNETTQNNKDDVVVLNKQYPPTRSDKNGSFCGGHDEELSSLAGNKPLELYDEDGDKVDGASFSGVTKGSFLKFEDNMYAVVEVVDSTPFEKETATSQPDLVTDGGEKNVTANIRRVSDIGGKEMLLNNTAKKRRRRGEVDDVVADDDDDDDDDKNVRVCQNNYDTIVTYPIYTNRRSLFFDVGSLNAGAVEFPCRFYCQIFKGKTFGLHLVEIDRRIVVTKNVTGNSKPAFGDVLFKINGNPLLPKRSLNTVCLRVRNMLSNSGGVELTFAEVPRFWSDVAEPFLKKREATGKRNAQLKE